MRTSGSRRPGAAGLLLVGLAAAAAQAQQGPPPAIVVVADTEMRELAPTVKVPGTVISRNDARLAAEVAGRLTWVAEVGTKLKADEPLARIDDVTLVLQREEYRGLVERERARLRFLEPEVERLRSLAAENNAARSRLDQTESDLDVARGDLTVARARLRQIEDQLSRTVIRAPFPGVVTERIRNLGERVGIGDPVMRLISPGYIEVLARVPLQNVAYLAEGSRLPVSNAFRSEIGVVRTIVPFGNVQSHMFEIRIDVDPQRWIVGEDVRIGVPTAAAREVLAVPRDALVLRRDGASVFRVTSDNTAERVAVTAGFAAGELIEVQGDLAAGDRVVIRGAERLRPGQSVAINGAPDGGGPSTQAGSGS